MPTEVRTGFARVRDVVTSRPLGDYLAGRFLAMTGAWMFRLAVGWLTWEWTQSPTMLGLATVALLAPQMLVSPLSGVVADSRDRRRVLAVAAGGAGTLKLVTAGAVAAGLVATPGLLVLAALSSAVGALDQASAKTTVASLVEEHDVATAISINSVLFNLAGFIGPALAGMLLWGVAPAAPLFAAALSTLAFVAALRHVPPLPPVQVGGGTAVGDFVAGLRHVADDAYLRLVFALHVASAMLARPFLDFIPALATTSLGGGPALVAAMTSAVGLGSVAGGLWLARRDNSAGVLTVVLGAFAILSAILLAIVWTPLAWTAPILAFAAGFGMILRAAGLQTLLQLGAARGMRGRVIALYTLVLHGGAMVGALGVGLIADWFGPRVGLTAPVLAAFLVFLLVRGPLTSAAANRSAAARP